MGCSCPTGKRIENPLSKQYNINKKEFNYHQNVNQMFQSKLYRRQTCRIPTCILDHEHHFCKRCLNKDSDHYFSDCKQTTITAVHEQNLSSYQINLKQRPDSKFVRSVIDDMANKQQHQIRAREGDEYRGRNLSQKQKKSQPYGSYNQYYYSPQTNQNTKFSSNYYQQNVKSNYNTSTISSYKDQLDKKYKK